MINYSLLSRHKNIEKVKLEIQIASTQFKMWKIKKQNKE